MGLWESDYFKIFSVLSILSIGCFISFSLLVEAHKTDPGNSESTWTWATFIGGGLLMLAWWGTVDEFKVSRETKRREKRRWEKWENTWKGKPEIFDFLEENKQPDDFPTLVSTISQFLDYCWFHPFVSDSYVSRINDEQSKRDLQRILNALDGIILSIDDLNSDRRFNYWRSNVSEYSLDILYTIAEFCGIERGNGLEFYFKESKNSEEKYSEYKDVPEEPNFVNLGEPNSEILEKCEAIDSAFDQDYQIKDISTFDLTEHKNLNYDLARTLRCCICDILNTRLTEEIVLTLQRTSEKSPFVKRYDKQLRRKLLDAMIIEIWVICGGLAIERKTYSDLRFQFSIQSMQLEKDRPKSSFRTKKSTNET